MATGVFAEHAGLGHWTVLAQSQAMTVNRLPNIFLQVRPLVGHVLRDSHLRVQMADAFLGFVPHPLSVVANIFGETLALLARLSPPSPLGLLLPFRVDRRQASELRRDFDQGLGDEDRNGVQVRSVSPKPESLGLQRYRTAAAERIKHRRAVGCQEMVDRLG